MDIEAESFQPAENMQESIQKKRDVIVTSWTVEAVVFSMIVHKCRIVILVQELIFSFKAQHRLVTEVFTILSRS